LQKEQAQSFLSKKLSLLSCVLSAFRTSSVDEKYLSLLQDNFGLIIEHFPMMKSYLEIVLQDITKNCHIFQANSLTIKELVQHLVTTVATDK